MFYEKSNSKAVISDSNESFYDLNGVSRLKPVELIKVQTRKERRKNLLKNKCSNRHTN